MRLLVRARHDHQRAARRESRAPRGQVGTASGRGHAKDARIRQVRPEDVDKRGDAAIAAA
jgi:hypothetical protein